MADEIEAFGFGLVQPKNEATPEEMVALRKEASLRHTDTLQFPMYLHPFNEVESESNWLRNLYIETAYIRVMAKMQEKPIGPTGAYSWFIGEISGAFDRMRIATDAEVLMCRKDIEHCWDVAVGNMPEDERSKSLG